MDVKLEEMEEVIIVANHVKFKNEFSYFKQKPTLWDQSDLLSTKYYWVLVILFNCVFKKDFERERVRMKMVNKLQDVITKAYQSTTDHIILQHQP